MLAFALTVLPLDGYRALLLDFTLELIALAGVLAALAGRPLLTALAPLFVVSFALGRQVGDAQLLSHGPAPVALWLFAVAMIAKRDHLAHRQLVLLAVAAGAIEAFLDQIISVPFIAGAFLIVAGVVLHHRSPSRSTLAVALDIAILAVAWGFGFVGTYAIKLLVSVVLLGGTAFQDFAHQLAFRVGTVDPELGLTADAHISRIAMFGRNLKLLSYAIWRLGYSSERSNVVLAPFVLALSFYGWIIAVQRWATSRSNRSAILNAGLPYLAAATLFLLWIAAMPEHAWRHAFMVRSFPLLLIGDWGWLFAAKATAGDGKHEASIKQKAIAQALA